MKITDYITKDSTCEFIHYREGELWYRCSVGGLEFPVPVDDTGNGIFLATDRAILFMRWIRKHLAALEQYRKEANQEQT